MTLASLPTIAVDIAAKLAVQGFNGDDRTRQVLCLAEEVGEFVAAARRWMGMARRPGPFTDVRAELADVVITAFVTAEVFGIDLDAAVADKLGEVYTRGWRQPATDEPDPADPKETTPL